MMDFKEGYKTSEFWLSIVSLGVPIGASLAMMFGYTVDQEALITALSGTITSGFYVIGRSWLKKSRNERAGLVESAEIYRLPLVDAPVEDEAPPTAS